MENKYLYSELTEKIIGASYTVWRKLGSGFLEKVYENSMLIELRKHRLKVLSQYPINIYYEDVLVGEYFADLIVEDKIIIELKAVSKLAKTHETQLINYLKATGFKVGLLINFGDDIEIKRRIM